MAATVMETETLNPPFVYLPVRLSDTDKRSKRPLEYMCFLDMCMAGGGMNGIYEAYLVSRTLKSSLEKKREVRF